MTTITSSHELLVEELQDIDTASLCDSNKSLRTIDPSIRSVGKKARCVGRARVVECDGDFLPVLQALAKAEPGDVLMVAGAGQKKAFAGELFINEAHRRGLAGLVIDGGCRDTASIQEIDLPVYAKWLTPMAGTVVCTAPEEGFNEVFIGGVPVKSGEIIVGDRDGIVVLTNEELDKAVTIARNIQHLEMQVLERVRGGTSLVDLVNLDEHVRCLRSGDSGSRLQFRL